MTVFDIFPFNDELDLLEIRLAELDPVVDVHVLAEAPVTQTGLPKPLHYADNKDRFARWADKIRHVVVDDMPTSTHLEDPVEMLWPAPTGHWEREHWQRQALERGLDGLADDDMVLVSDLDEIPTADAVRMTRRGVTGRLRLALHVYWLNWRWTRPLMSSAVFVDGLTVREFGPQGCRQTAPGVFPLACAGWHLTYQGGADAIALKLASLAHHEVNRPPYNTAENIRRSLTTGADLFGRDRPVESVPLSALPACVAADPARFAHLLGPELNGHR